MEDIEKLQDYEKVRGKLKLPLDIKPCIANLLDESCPSVNSGLTPFIIACELFRIGKNKQQIQSFLTKANIKPSKVRSAVKSAITGTWSYGCPRLGELDLCLYESRFDCWWWNRMPSKNEKEGEEKDFWRYNWPQRLKRTEEALYLAIRTIEIRRGYKAGSRLFVNWDQLYEVSRVTRCTIGKKLEALRKIGLIKYRPGEERIKGSKARATEVTRIIPIPRP